MEEVLDLYCLPYDEKVPLVCMDEQPVQFLKETCHPIPAKAGSPERIDYEYERNGTGNVFMFVEPPGCRRHVNVREHKKSLDWAQEIKELLDVEYPKVERIILVMDNLNTHTIASLYKAFTPGEARQLARKLEIHHTPKHGSWLNVAECELSVLTRHCLGRRIGDIQSLHRECKAWEWNRNLKQIGVDWQFTTNVARIKLKQLYPQVND